MVGVTALALLLSMVGSAGALGAGTLERTWGTAGSGDGQFNFPSGVAVDGSGNVYVVDYGNNCVEKFDSNGNFLLKLGSDGSSDGQFHVPGGVAVDQSGNVYVLDSGNSRVQKFDSNGNFLLTWNAAVGSSTVSGMGIAVDQSDNVYVADFGNSRI